MMKQNASKLIARTFVEEALACAKAAGIDRAAMLAELGIEPRRLDHLAPNDFARLWLDMSRRMEDEFFGLGARPMRPGSTTLLGHAVRDAPSLAVALRRMLRFLRVVLDEPFGEASVTGGKCVVTLFETGSPRSAFAYRTFFLILHGFTCWLARERIPLYAVAFPCAAPYESNDYEDFFGVPVSFGATAARLSFDARYLARPVNRSDAELKSFLRTTPESLLRSYRDTGGIKKQIIESCLNGPAVDWPNASAVAARLGLSRTTLHRRLSDTGQSLTDLKNEMRRTRATALLARTNWSIARIAAELGYAEESAFFRAFRRWYGVTPGQFRRGG